MHCMYISIHIKCIKLWGSPSYKILMLCKTLGLSFSPPLKNCSHFPFPDGLSKSPWHRYSFQNSEHHHIVQIPVRLFQTTLQKKKSTSLQTNLSDIPHLEKTNINFLKASLYKINPTLITSSDNIRTHLVFSFVVLLLLALRAKPQCPRAES